MFSENVHRGYKVTIGGSGAGRDHRRRDFGAFFRPGWDRTVELRKKRLGVSTLHLSFLDHTALALDLYLDRRRRNELQFHLNRVARGSFRLGAMALFDLNGTELYPDRCHQEKTNAHREQIDERNEVHLGVESFTPGVPRLCAASYARHRLDRKLGSVGGPALRPDLTCGMG